MGPSFDSVRPAAVAGRFYPDDPEKLRRELRRLIADSPCDDPDASDPDALKAMIVPHAGYAFCGPVAARAYNLLRVARGRVRRVVLFGPAHYEMFTGLAVPRAQAFATPLGEVAVDREAVNKLLALPCVHALDSPHAPEHSLEVHLPLLIEALGGAERFTIVPLLFAEASSEDAAAALEAVWGGDETLIVISSDLSHFLDHAAASAADRATADAVVAGRLESVGPMQACGHTAVRGLMRIAESRGLHCACVDLRNSGDVAPQFGRERVVGYGAFVYTR